jgi:uncharacterized protein involved in response to NO
MVWREIAAADSWAQAPIGALITFYAGAHIGEHLLESTGLPTDVGVRIGLGLIMVLLALIGGRVTPNFTGELLEQHQPPIQPAAFSRFDVLSIVLVALAALNWMIQPESPVTGGLLVGAGLINVGRLARWYGWLTWREPLVLMLHVGYGWLALSLLLLGGATLGVGLPTADALHALTAGAVGAMTLAVMTRASLGHTGRVRHADGMTVLMYALVNFGAVLRVFGAWIGVPDTIALGSAAACWAGAYLMFAIVYGRYLFSRSLDE